MRKEMQDGFASIQRQLLDTSETSPKWGVTLPLKTLEELDVLENQLAEDEDLQQKMVCTTILYYRTALQKHSGQILTRSKRITSCMNLKRLLYVIPLNIKGKRYTYTVVPLWRDPSLERPPLNRDRFLYHQYHLLHLKLPLLEDHPFIKTTFAAQKAHNAIHTEAH